MPQTALRITRSGFVFKHFVQRHRAQTADIQRMAVVHLVGHARARHSDFGRVDHDDKVARVHVRRVGGLVLAHDDLGDLACHAAERLAFGVDHVPLLRGARLGRASPCMFCTVSCHT